MNTYIITETQNANSIRKGYEIQAKDLASAKRIASKNQVFEGTVLSIYNEKEELLTRKQKTWFVPSSCL